MGKKISRIKQTQRRLLAESLERRDLMASVPIQVSIENLSPVGGLSATPVWVGFHNGDFDVGREGRRAVDFPGLELLAEEGDTRELGARFDATCA